MGMPGAYRSPVIQLSTMVEVKSGNSDEPDVPVEIALYPVGMRLYPGEQLRLVVTSQNIIGIQLPFAKPTPPDNHGRHIIHTGGQYDSHLVLPILKRGV